MKCTQDTKPPPPSYRNWMSQKSCVVPFFSKQFVLYTWAHSNQFYCTCVRFSCSIHMIMYLFYVKIYFLYASSNSYILSFSAKSCSWSRSLYKCILLPSQVPSGDFAHSSVDGELRCNTMSPDSLCESLERSAVLISQHFEYL